MLSIVIPTIEGREVRLCELLNQLGDKFEVIVVDNPNLSLSEKRNYGLAQATHDLIYFLDDDNALFKDTLMELACIMDTRSPYYDANVGIAASVAVNEGRVIDGGSKRFLVAGFQLGFFTDALVKSIPWPYEVDEVANAFMVKRKVFQDIGGFDSQRFPMDMDEADLCLRARKKGWKVIYAPGSMVTHPKVPKVPKFRRKINAYYMGRNRILFQRKHLSFVQFICYLSLFNPLFVLVYTISLGLHGQVGFLPAFYKGVVDGLRNKLSYTERY